MRYMILNNLKLEDIVNQKVYDRVIANKALVSEEDIEL